MGVGLRTALRWGVRKEQGRCGFGVPGEEKLGWWLVEVEASRGKEDMSSAGHWELSLSGIWLLGSLKVPLGPHLGRAERGREGRGRSE